jgi:AcrR family transcriptional regulator
MQRARAGILTAAAELVAEGGPRAVTMSSVARRGAVAKATVYNHYRDRDELLAALLGAQRDQLVAHCSSVRPADRLTAAADWISHSTALTGLRQHDPAMLVRLVIGASTDPSVLSEVTRWCPPGEDPQRALRWLLSFAVAPSGARVGT